MSKDRLRVLAFSSYFLPGYKGGGPIKTLKNIFNSLSEEFSFLLVTKDRDLGDAYSYDSVKVGDWNDVGSTSVFYTQPGFRGLIQIVRVLRRTNYDVVYLNSFFSLQFSFFPLLIARVLKRVVILAPRGELSSGALGIKSFKKRLFVWFYRVLRLENYVVFQASSGFEAAEFREVLGPNIRVKIAENIASQEFAKTVGGGFGREVHAVFLSRISPKKNLLGAIEMLARVRVPVSYHIYGPIEDANYWSECEKALGQLPIHIKVEYEGPLRPEIVVKTIANYDLFFLPTKGENYGHVIAEALCAGLPLLIADTTPWRELQKKGIGWDLPLNEPERFTRVLEDFANLSRPERIQVRQDVLNWAKEKFSQREAHEANVDMFRFAFEKE